MTRGGVGNGISRLSTGGAAPRNTTVCRPGETRSQSASSLARRISAAAEPSTAMAWGRQPRSDPGSGIATCSAAWMVSVIPMLSTPASTRAAAISAQRGTQSGGSSNLDSSSRSNSLSGVCADAPGLALSVSASRPAPRKAAERPVPRLSPPGSVQRFLRISAAMTAANNSNIATSKKRSNVTAHRGMTIKRIVWAGSTGPLQPSR